MEQRYEQKYYELLSQQFPNVQSAATELINLNAILNLPKGTEHYIADIHGEYDAFNHFLKNASGILKEKINQHFSDLDNDNRRRFSFFLYYPHDMLNKYQKAWDAASFELLLRDVLKRMVELARIIATKYTKSHVGKNLPKEFSYIIQELLYESNKHEDKRAYYDAIIDAIFTTGREKKLIIELSRFIRRLAIDRLHIVGDIFDRGPKPHLVMDKIMKQKSVDIQWGNHDIIWMGAASGDPVSIANVIRIAARYNNLDCLEDGYGINLRYLSSFANDAYKDDPCTNFYPKNLSNENAMLDDPVYVARMHKAISVIQFKLEQAVIDANPGFGLEHRAILQTIDKENNTVVVDGKSFELNTAHFPTVYPNDPTALSHGEEKVIKHLRQMFLHNEMLQDHIRFMFRKGSMYLKANDTLLFHAGFPINEDGTFLEQSIDGVTYMGKGLFDMFESKLRNAYLNRYEPNNPERDFFMILWQGPSSPLFAKDSMRTFERYFIDDKSIHKEHMNPYFNRREDHDLLDRIFQAFGMDPARGKIINGHVPLDVTKGEDVVLADKRMYLIDGGMSKQYASKTDIGGYTLISDSYAYFLVSHQRFDGYESLIGQEKDIISVTHSEDINHRRTYIYDTDNGVKLKGRVDDLSRLIELYKSGALKEKPSA